MKILEEIELFVDNQDIIQLLRSKNSSVKGTKAKAPSTQLLQDIELMKKEAFELIETKAMYDIFSSEILQPRHLFERSKKTILAVCTISEKLEKKISTYMKEGKLTKGVILDAVASVAAEECASQLYDLILEENKEILQNNKYTARFSPGYCRWTIVEGQQLIFTLLPVAEKINVKLSSTSMMIPRKSVSFAINIGPNVEEDLGIKECEICEKYDCDYRR